MALTKGLCSELETGEQVAGSPVGQFADIAVVKGELVREPLGNPKEAPAEPTEAFATVAVVTTAGDLDEPRPAGTYSPAWPAAICH